MDEAKNKNIMNEMIEWISKTRNVKRTKGRNG